MPPYEKYKGQEATEEDFEEHYGEDAPPMEYFKNTAPIIDGQFESIDELEMIRDHVLIRRYQFDEADQTTSGGIVVPETLEDDPIEGEVLEVGKRRKMDGSEDELFFEEGDRVLFGRGAGFKFIFEEDTYLIIPEGSIVARFKWDPDAPD